MARNQKLLETSDYLTTDLGEKLNLKFGVQIYNRNGRERRAENTNGTFYFGGARLQDNSTEIFIFGLEQYRCLLLNLPGGTPTQYLIASGVPRVSVNQWRIALFAQGEWRLSSKVLLSAGLRYEAQTAPVDFLNFAPRFGLAFAPDKKQNWTLRARAGVFYDRIIEQLTLEAERLDGVRQRQIILNAPSYPFPLASGSANDAISTRRIFVPAMRSPASLQIQFKLKRRFRRN